MCGTPPLKQSTPIQIHLTDPKTLKELFNAHRPSHIADVWSDDSLGQSLHSLLEDGSVRHAIFRAVDAALYRAKQAGRNQVMMAE
jgi:GGDEF domain-containing protein